MSALLSYLTGEVKYSVVPTEAEDGPDASKIGDHGVDYDSAFDFSQPSGIQLGSAFKYRSPAELKSRDGFPSHKYAANWVLGKRFREEHVQREHSGQFHRSILESAVILLCYLGILATLPFSLFFCLRFVAQFERLVVFRLGRLQAAKGPGTVIVLPCIDNWRPVDLRTKAFHVPPLQVVTADKGLVELGATVYYRIKDALAAINSVQDWNQATRTLAHTTMQRTLNKKEADEIAKRKREIGAELAEDLNTATFAWGMEITEVAFSDVRVLKEPENNAEAVIKQLSNPDVAKQIFSQFAGQFAAAAQRSGGSIPEAVEIAGEEVKRVERGIPSAAKTPDAVAIDIEGPSTSAAAAPPAFDVDLEKMVFTLRSVLSPELVAEVGATFLVEVPGRGSFFLDLARDGGSVELGTGAGAVADVKIRLGHADLMELIIGQLSPFDAYLSGKISLEGNPRTAVRLEALAKHIKAKYGSGETT